MARWVAHATDWGTVAAFQRATGLPIGGIVSHSDGPRCKPSGRVFFYLAGMSEVCRNILADPRATYTVTEAQLPGGCPGYDPEDPPCTKITALGKIMEVSEDDVEAAREAMFSRHPAMADWPVESHKFAFYELVIDEVHLLDWYGGVRVVTADDYYGAQLTAAGGGAECSEGADE